MDESLPAFFNIEDMCLWINAHADTHIRRSTLYIVCSTLIGFLLNYRNMLVFGNTNYKKAQLFYLVVYFLFNCLIGFSIRKL